MRLRHRHPPLRLVEHGDEMQRRVAGALPASPPKHAAAELGARASRLVRLRVRVRVGVRVRVTVMITIHSARDNLEEGLPLIPWY